MSLLNGLTSKTNPALTDILYILSDPSGTPLDRKVTIEDLLKALSTISTGTAPLVISSTTKVDNLNVDSVDNAHLSTDITLNSNSDIKIPSEKAVKGYIDANNFTSTKFVSGSNVTTTSQTLVDITGLSFAALANSVYEIEAVLLCTTSAVTTGTKYGVQFSTAGASFIGLISGTGATTAVVDNSINALNTANATALNTTSSATALVIIKGFVTTGVNAGNITIQHLKVTSGTSTVKIGSTLKVRKVA